jgi:uncharacterized MAPEG superfamily protein
MVLVAIMTAARRGKASQFLNEEDVKLFKGAQADAEDLAVARIKRLHLNDLENIPAFLALGLVYLLAGGTPLGAQAYFYTFLAARLLHSLFYLAKLQPWRTLSWLVQVLVMLGLSVQILMRVFG